MAGLDRGHPSLGDGISPHLQYEVPQPYHGHEYPTLQDQEASFVPPQQQRLSPRPVSPVATAEGWPANLSRDKVMRKIAQIQTWRNEVGRSDCYCTCSAAGSSVSDRASLDQREDKRSSRRHSLSSVIALRRAPSSATTSAAPARRPASMTSRASMLLQAQPDGSSMAGSGAGSGSAVGGSEVDSRYPPELICDVCSRPASPAVIPPQDCRYSGFAGSLGGSSVSRAWGTLRRGLRGLARRVVSSAGDSGHSKDKQQKHLQWQRQLRQRALADYVGDGNDVVAPQQQLQQQRPPTRDSNREVPEPGAAADKQEEQPQATQMSRTRMYDTGSPIQALQSLTKPITASARGSRQTGDATTPQHFGAEEDDDYEEAEEKREDNILDRNGHRSPADEAEEEERDARARALRERSARLQRARALLERTRQGPCAESNLSLSTPHGGGGGLLVGEGR